MKQLQSKVGTRTLVILPILIALLIGLYSGWVQQQVVNPLLAPLDQKANSVLQRSLVLSSASFATARLIDRGIAFVSEAEVGIGIASVKPGQLLKPVQDMAERYSDVMVLAMASVGVQLVLLEFGKLAALPLFGGGILACLVALWLAPAGWRPGIQGLLRIFIALLLLIRIGIPLAAWSVAELSDWVLESQRVAAETVLTEETSALQRLEQPIVAADESALSWLRQMAGSASDVFSAVKYFSDSMVEKFVQLIVVYLLQTVVFPLLSLWILWQMGRWFVSRPLTITPGISVPAH